MYRKKFVGDSRDEAMLLAERFIKTLDYMTQPSIGSVYPENGAWVVIVEYWGLD